MLANYRNPVFSATSNNNRGTAVAAGASDVDLPSRHCRIIVPALLPSRHGSQPAVVALQPIVPPAPPRSRSKSRVRAADGASSALRVVDPHPIPAAPESAADAGAAVGSTAQLSHSAASAGGSASRHRERRNIGKQAARKSRGDSPPPLIPELEQARLAGKIIVREWV